MNMSFAKRLFFGIAALALPSVMAQAADGPTPFLGGGIISALDSTKEVTHSTLGYNITGGFDFRLADGTYGFRPGLAVNFLPGSDKDGVKTSLTNFQVYGDLVFNSGVQNLSFTAGLSVQRWYYKTTAATGTTSPYQLDGKGFLNGTKLGARLGMEYRFNKNISSELVLQVVDFGAKDGEARTNVVTPSWLQVGVKYHF